MNILYHMVLITKNEIPLKGQEPIEIIQWKLTNDMFENWNNLSCSNKIGNDCAINTLAFLELIDKTLAEELSKKTNFREDGLTIEQINFLLMDQNVFLMNRKHILFDTRNKHVVAHSIEKFEPEECERFVRSILPGHGTIIGIEYESKGGHAMVYVKGLDGKNYLYDPQSMVLLKNDEVLIFLNTNIKRFNYWKLVENQDTDKKPNPGNLHKRKFGTITPEVLLKVSQKRKKRRQNASIVKSKKRKISRTSSLDDAEHKKKRIIDSPRKTTSMDIVD